MLRVLFGEREVRILIIAGEARTTLVRGSLAWGDGESYVFSTAEMLALVTADGVTCAHVYPCRETPYLLTCTVDDADGVHGTCHLAVLVQNTPPQLALEVAVQDHQVTVIPTADDQDGTVEGITIAWDADPEHITTVASGDAASFTYADDCRRQRIIATAIDDEGATAHVTVELALGQLTADAMPWGQSPGARSHERPGSGEASA